MIKTSKIMKRLDWATFLPMGALLIGGCGEELEPG